jgi:hypothetical protein
LDREDGIFYFEGGFEGTQVWIVLQSGSHDRSLTRPRRTARHENGPQSFVRTSLFVWLVADGWCWFVLREKYCWLVVDGWFVLREKYCWLVADKPSEHGVRILAPRQDHTPEYCTLVVVRYHCPPCEPTAR